MLGFHPVARMNPYQALLYSQAYASGVAPVGLPLRSDFDSLQVARSIGVGTILHLHWTSEIISGAENTRQAEARATEFVEHLESLQAAGSKIAWSVHNVLPHQCPFPEVESRLRARLSEIADVIHVMSPGTVEATFRYYSLPVDKIIEVPHPSYVGAYPSHVDRATSRFELGYEPTDLVLGALGSIQPYKGLTEFADAVRNQIELDPDVRALVGGIPGRDEESRQLLLELEKANHVRLVARQLSDREMASLMVALDVAVLPYRASLNSGAALLALSFGVPVVAPLTGGFRDLIAMGFGVGYDADDPDGLTESLSNVRQFLERYDRAAALAYAADLNGGSVSARFFNALLAKLS